MGPSSPPLFHHFHPLPVCNISIFFLFLLFFISSVEAGIHEDRLIDELLEKRDYQRVSRPVKNDSDLVTFNLKTSLQSLLNVDEKMELLLSRLWFTYKWTDPRLTWEPEEHGGVDSIRLAWNRIWTPDLLLYNSAASAIDSKFPVNVILSHTGECTWMPLGIWTSSCAIDIRWFPFDEQHCKLKFGVWSYGGGEVNLTMDSNKMDLINYQMNGEWDLIDAPAVRSAIYYACCPGAPFVDITYTLIIRRRTLYYGSNLIIPCALISSLTIFTFLLPSDSNAKITLGITILLALSVFQLIVAEIVPSTSISVPLIGIYFAFLMVLCTISLFVTTLVINFHYRTPEFYEISPFVEKYVNNYLAWLMRMSRPDKKPSGPFSKAVEEAGKAQEGDGGEVGGEEGQPIITMGNPLLGHQSSPTIGLNRRQRKKAFASQLLKLSEDGAKARCMTSDPSVRLLTTLLRLRQELACVLAETRFMTRNLRDADADSDVVNEWRFAARVIDRFSFLLFTSLLVLGTLGIFFSSENLQRRLTGVDKGRER